MKCFQPQIIMNNFNFSKLFTSAAVARAAMRSIAFLILAACWEPRPSTAAPVETVDATSLNNKVMAGYQGWFRAPGDRPGYNGWAHWFNGGTPSVRGLGI